jgi:AraC family transcriptional regulator
MLELSHMKALEDTISTLGEPVLVRVIGAPSAPFAAIARWRHSATIVDVSPSESIRLAMSLIDKRNARNIDVGSLRDHDLGGSISVFSPREGFKLEVVGEADVVQLFLDLTYAETALDGPLELPAVLELDGDEMRTLLMKVLVGSARKTPDDTLELEEDLHGLVVGIERHTTDCQVSRGSSKLHRGGLSSVAFRRIEEMVSATLEGAKTPTLGEMAAAASLSVTHFRRAFRTHTGFSPHSYIVRRRMNRAIALLRVDRSPIADVADKVGFSTPAHFVAAFRTAMGVTPGKLRDALT